MWPNSNCFVPRQIIVFIPPPIGERNIVMSVSVYLAGCVSLSVFVNCPSAIISLELHSDLHQFFVNVTQGCGSVLLWRRSDTLCTSVFMDDVILAHKPRLLDVAAQLRRSAHAALGVAINCAQQYQLQTNGRTRLLFGRLKYLTGWQQRGGVCGL